MSISEKSTRKKNEATAQAHLAAAISTGGAFVLFTHKEGIIAAAPPADLLAVAACMAPILSRGEPLPSVLEQITDVVEMIAALDGSPVGHA